MAKPVLYSFRRCPYAMRARMALAISHTDCEMREVVLRDKPAAMLEVSPKGTVPVLVLEEGQIIDESIDIMRWALARNDPENWLDGDDKELITTMDGPFKHNLDRYKYSNRHDSDPAEHQSACLVILEQLEERLGAAQFLCGAARSMADMATFPFIRQFANTDRDWFDAQAIPHVQNWLEAQIESPLFQQIMVKRDQWNPETA